MAAIGRFARQILRSGLLSILTIGTAFAAPVPTEYQVKAVFLFNFAHFVEWPSAAFSAADSPFVICVLGHDPFGSFLEDTVRGELIKGRSFAIARHRQIADATGCQILFIDRTTDKTGLQDALKTLEHQGTLTVGESGATNPPGVAIRFITENQKIRLRIDVDAARSGGLVISSKLLRPAQVVGPTGSN